MPTLDNHPRTLAAAETVVGLTRFTAHKLTTPFRFVHTMYDANKNYQLIQVGQREAQACPHCKDELLYKYDYCTEHQYVYWSVIDNRPYPRNYTH